VGNTNLPAYEVDTIRNRVRKEGIGDGQLAEILGCSRTHINQMFNHAAPMRRIYRYAIMAVILELRRNKSEQLP
jgi:hypothetical protein